MSDQYLGEIRTFSGNYAPKGWAMCNGQLLPISNNQALYTLIGTTYGGDGKTTFALPDLRGRIGIHMGTGYPLAQAAGTEEVTLTVAQIPAHTHAAGASSQNGTQSSPNNSVWATSPLSQYNATIETGTTLAADAIGLAGGSQPHDNMMPFVTVTFIIALQGIFPSRS